MKINRGRVLLLIARNGACTVFQKANCSEELRWDVFLLEYYIWIVTASSAQGPNSKNKLKQHMYEKLNGRTLTTYKLLGTWAEARGQKLSTFAI